MVSPMAVNYANRVNEYVAGRPEYPIELLSDLPLADTIIELGAGTGKFTRLLALTGKRILAIEPIDAMAAQIQVDCPPGVELLKGSAEEIPASDSIADIVCCGTSFHWFDYARATCEIYRVLKNNGALALVWNLRNDRVSWVATLGQLINSYPRKFPHHASGEWKAIFRDARFHSVATKTYAMTHVVPPSGLVDHALSTCGLAAFPPDEAEIVRNKISAIIESDQSLTGQKEVEFPYVTELYLFRKRP